MSNPYLSNPYALSGEAPIGPENSRWDIPIPSHIPSAVYEAPCECHFCQHGWKTVFQQDWTVNWYKGTIRDPDARRQLAKHIQSASEDREYLKQRLSSHGDVIMNRWKKKSRDKRQALLLEAMPGLSEERWIILRYGMMEESIMCAIEGRTVKRRHELLVHWLSHELLRSNPSFLFALLHNRSTYSPQEWFAWDWKQLVLSWAGGYFDVLFSIKSVLLYDPKFGKLVDWEDEPSHRADMLGFPMANLIFEGQAYLMSGLRAIVDKILEGVDFGKPASSVKWKEMTTLGFRHANELEMWSPYTNQPFSAPPTFSIDGILATVQARMDALGDHLYFLQTDLPYLRRHIKTICQGKAYQMMGKENLGAVVSYELLEDVTSYWRWGWIHTECQHLKLVHGRYRDSIYPGAPLPRQFDNALGSLKVLVLKEVLRRGEDFQLIKNYRPGFASKFDFKNVTEQDGEYIQFSRKSQIPTNSAESFANDPLDWCLNQLEGSPETLSNHDHAVLFAYLEHYLANSSVNEKARMDELLYQKLSDLASCHEILASIQLHRPQSQVLTVKECEETGRLAWRTNKFTISRKDRSYRQTGVAFMKDFYDVAPFIGKKTTEWMEHEKRTRKAVDDFWTGLRKTPRRLFAAPGIGLTSSEIDEHLKVIEYNLSTDHENFLFVEEQRLKAEIEKARGPLPVVTPFNDWNVQASSESSTVAPQPKSKAKTRPVEGNSDVVQLDQAVEDLDLGSEDEKELKTAPQQVTKRAYEMLKTMFPATAIEANSKGIEWINFVYAMSDMGFSARNAGGSVVSFSSQDASDKRRINFHKPHPGSKIDVVVLRSMGTRLTRHFGWKQGGFDVAS